MFYRLLCVMGFLLYGHAALAQVVPLKTNDFLNSIGSGGGCWGQLPASCAPLVNYAGIRVWRTGDRDFPHLPHDVVVLMSLVPHLKVVWCCRNHLDSAYAEALNVNGGLLGIEGPNEPNNEPFKYQEQQGGGSNSYLPVAKWQRDLYGLVHNNPKLKGVEVWASPESGGPEVDNVGLQCLTIGPNCGPDITLMPQGTVFADRANVHDYIHSENASSTDNLLWNGKNPLSRSSDGLNSEFGLTWSHHYYGYSNSVIASVPWASTETGSATTGTEKYKGNPKGVSELQQGNLLLDMYLLISS
jgi:hypothetical protein